MPRLRSILPPAPWTALPLVVLLVVGCVAPDRGAAGVPAVLYVANSLDGTVTRLDAQSGRALGPALPAGPTPLQLVSGSGGGVLVLSQSTGEGAALSRLVPLGGAGDPSTRWAAQPVPLQPATPAAHATLLAGDGDRHAVVVYAPPGSDVLHVALIDVPTGRVEGIQRVPAANAVVRSVAVQGGATGAVAYLGLWRWPGGAGESGPSVASGGLILAIHLASGAVLGSVRLDGAPTHLLLAPAPGRTGDRLYAVQQVPGPVRAVASETDAAPRTWELVTLHPATLTVECTIPLDGPLTALASSPDGDHLYALAQHEATSTLLVVDTASGIVRRLQRLPGVALGLVVTDERVYLPHAFGAAVQAVDRRSGRLLQIIPVGRHPVAIAVGGAQR